MSEKIKISAPDWCFFQDGFDADEYYSKLKNMGIASVEMVEESRWPSARKAGLPMLNLSGPGMQKGLNRVENHAELLPEIRKAIDLANSAGIAHVIVFSGNREGQPDSDGIAQCIDGLKSMAPYAKSKGVNLLFEMLNSYDHSDYQADSGAYGFKVVRGVGSESVKVLYDVYHLLRMGDNVLPDILDNLDIIEHFHLADVPKRSFLEKNDAIDYKGLIEKVRAKGYDGYWGLEFVPGRDVFGEIDKSIALITD